MNLFQEIINSKNNGKPDEVAALLREAIGLKADELLCLDVIRKFIEREGVSEEVAQSLRLYLENNNLLEEDLLED